MDDKKKIEIISDFMRTGYKITRIKNSKTNKFQRGIVLDAGTIKYVKQNTKSALRHLVFNSLKEIFPVSDNIIEEAMGNYLTTQRKKPLPRRHFPKRKL